MADNYVAREGETLDYIAWKYYGSTENRVVEQVLEVNPGLADLGPELPAGQVVLLPDIAKPAELQGIRLWT